MGSMRARAGRFGSAMFRSLMSFESVELDTVRRKEKKGKKSGTGLRRGRGKDWMMSVDYCTSCERQFRIGLRTCRAAYSNRTLHVKDCASTVLQ